MTLSNTAVPKHYELFRAKVLSGEIPVCHEISLEMQRIDWLIANSEVYYDDKAIDGWCEFVEEELTLTDGGDVHLMDSFKLWAEQLLSWKIFVQRRVWDDEAQDFVMKTVCKRLRDMQYLIVARGSAKSMYVSFLQAYFLVIDRATTEAVTVAPTMKQAEEVLTPVKTAITTAKGPLFKYMTAGSLSNTTGNRLNRPQLASTKKGIENLYTNSSLQIRAMSIDKCQGLRTKYNSVDEWLSGDTRENVINALMQGARKFEDPILVAISSEGVVRNGVGDSIKLELAAILRGDMEQWNVSIFHYKLDDVAEVKIPRMWVKANPNIGITVSYETYDEDVKRAELIPSVRNEILAKRFGLPMEGFVRYFTYEETLPHRKQNYQGMPASLGVDLSRGDDFCAFTLLFPLGRDRYGVQARSYISRRTLDLLPPALRVKYEEFITEETLVIFDGTVLDMMVVYADLMAWVDANKFDLRTMGYDTYNADSFAAQYVIDWGPFGVEKVIQGVRTESVPLGEIKKMAGSRDLIFYESIMQFCLGNAVAWVDTNGNRKLWKIREDEKIDNVSALLDAFVAIKLNPDQFE